jgi:hypothetical protein
MVTFGEPDVGAVYVYNGNIEGTNAAPPASAAIV